MSDSRSSEVNNGDVQTLLRHAPFQSFWSARILSTLAVQIQTVAVGWQVYDLTRSAFALGMIGLVQFAPAILLTLVVGQVADRYNRRWIIRICQTLASCIALILAIGSYQGWLTEHIIFALVFVFGIARAFESPSNSAL
ncbi:MAG TPA: MFS transporter, partial [Spongiibacteraceae bacterium]|nr:MFS transporter [Spongiibacteraceae bacterium]